MKVLVTGGAGFIGSHICEELIHAKFEVVAVDNLITGKESNVPAGIKFIRSDIRNSVDEIFEIEQPEYVIHMAAQVSVSKSTLNPSYDADENIMGTINLLNACVKYNVKKFIFASSAAIYGNPNYLPIEETHALNPLSFYGLSKLSAELYIQLFSALCGLKYTILRYSNVYGIRQDSNGEAGVIAIFSEKFLNNQQPYIHGDGHQTRDFVFVRDVAKANVLALEKGENEIFNISSHSEVSINQLIKEYERTLEIKANPIHGANREGDIRESVLSNKKAKEHLGWCPSYSIRNGLSEMISFYKKESEHVYRV
ncbi:NAD-dependent epimerase/dehydratase family protein [Metabacillus idriensis]|uniref:NAD-dependent epimerase/dehydratase family protein n=1 Tax=Metabacillus idriensis TaxID=324768 RepID=A0A6I2MCM5_9BACI|nr:NAD-dependent epimerase/dehydratase family protein [Metabacillus idriensis]MCM3598321.1 NAD-dependent epimerase/dehydratase family protein [Metabacillus idriensis]MRX55057.1 NAD-dependent epimerase/dehydratase family protein [Metabacillus idriensis]OHR71596.1 UDP-glucose 4-epimerase [Bacillus sp. HMSC76G11]